MTIQSALSNGTRRFTQVETWTWGLLNAIVVGGSTSVSSWLGMAAAHGAGLDVPVLNFKALGVIFLSGAGVRFFAYLSQGLPQLTRTTETSFVQKSADGTTTAQSSRTVITAPDLTPPPTAANIPSSNQTKT